MPDGSQSSVRYISPADRKARQAEELDLIRENLRHSAQDLAVRLLGTGGRRTGLDLRYGENGGMRVTIAGSRAGFWSDYTSGEMGDMLKLIRREQGASFPQALDYARSYLGMPDPDYTKPVSDRERKEMSDRVKARKAEDARAEAAARKKIEARNSQVARRANYIWKAYEQSPATAAHPYVARKGIDPVGLRVNRRGVLLAPVHAPDKTIQTLQRIWPDGYKCALKGGRMKNGYTLLGQVDPTKPLVFCEGVATGYSIHQATKLPVMICYSVTGIRDVTQWWRKANPEQLMIVAGDNDHAKPRMDPPKANVGAEMAERLQKEVRAVPLLPPFAEKELGSDWNDYAQAHGATAVKGLFDQAISAATAAKEVLMPDGSIPTPTVGEGSAAGPVPAPAQPSAAQGETQKPTGAEGAGAGNSARAEAGATAAEMPVTPPAAPAAAAAATTPPAGPEAPQVAGGVETIRPALGEGSEAAAPARPVDPRRVLVEALVVESSVTLGLAPEKAKKASEEFVSGLDDAKIRTIMETAPTRGWVMKADGSLDIDATAARLKPAGSDAAPAPAAAATAGASAAAGGADPLRGALSQMAAQSEALRTAAPDLLKTIETLGARAGQPEALRHDGLRTRIAYAIMDFERTTGTKVEMPDDLRREMDGRMVNYPGLSHPRAQAMLRQTATIASVDLIRDIRRTIADIVKSGPQDTPDVSDRLDVLDHKIQVLGGRPRMEGFPDEREGTAAGPRAAAPTGPEEVGGRPASGDRPLSDAEKAAAAAATVAAAAPGIASASPGPGPQADPAPVYAGKPAAVSPPGGGAAPDAARKDLAGKLLAGAQQGAVGGMPPWHKWMSGLTSHMETFTEKVAERRTARLVSDAEASGKAALGAVEKLTTGPARSILDRIQTAASREPGGMEAVLKEMKEGGTHSELRKEFNDALRLSPQFSSGYTEAMNAVNKYGDARRRQMLDFERAGLDPGKAAPLERIDAAIGEEVMRIPGRKDGTSAFEELASKVGDILKSAVTKVRDLVTGAKATVEAETTRAPSPSP